MDERISNMDINSLNLLHAPKLQTSVWNRLWSGLFSSIFEHPNVQDLDLVISPSPQGAEHADQSLHSSN